MASFRICLLVLLLLRVAASPAQRTFYYHTPNGIARMEAVPGKVSLQFPTVQARNAVFNDLHTSGLLQNAVLPLGETAGLTIVSLNGQAAIDQLPAQVVAHPVLRSADGVEHAITAGLMVKLRRAADFTLLQAAAAEQGCMILRENAMQPQLYHLAAANADGLAAANALMETGLFAWVQPDLLSWGKLFTPPVNDSLYPDQWTLKNTATANQFYLVPPSCATPGADIDIENAWPITTGGGIKVAVLDEGVDLTHPDLNDNLLTGYSSTWYGTPAVLLGPDFGGPVGTHGTWCAGLIAAEANNQIGIAGIAYSANILPVRCFYNGALLDSWAADAINWAWQQGADVLSCSWGGGGSSFAINEAIHQAVTQGRNGKGCLVFFATGNSNDEVKYPASNPEVIAVGASNPNDERKRPTDCTNWSWGSSYGLGLDLLAPGTETVTTKNGGGYYNEFVGTSASCPNAAGVGALVLAANPALSGAQARRIVEQTAQKVHPELYAYAANVPGQPHGSWHPEVGYGRVDAAAAVALASLAPAADLAIYLNHPHFSLCDSQIVPQLTVTNHGTATVTSFAVSYTVDGGTPVVVPQTTTLSPGASQVFSLGPIAATDSQHTLTFQLLPSINASLTDGYLPDNEIIDQLWRIAATPSLPYHEDFEANDLQAGFWEVVNDHNDVIQWEIVPAGGKSGHYAARVNCSSYGVNGASEKLISRPFDLSGYSQATLGFTYAYRYVDIGINPAYNNYQDSLFVYVSTDCGMTWDVVYANGESGDNGFSTAANGETFFEPARSSDWCSSGVDEIPCIQIDLSAYTGAGKEKVRFMFEVRNHFGNCLYIDDVALWSGATAALGGGGAACAAGTYPAVLVGLGGKGPWEIIYQENTTVRSVKGILETPYVIQPSAPGTFVLKAVAAATGIGRVLQPDTVQVTILPAEATPLPNLSPVQATVCSSGQEIVVSAAINTAGNALTFNGITDYVTLPAFNMPGDHLTIDLWAKPTDLSGRRSIFWQTNALGDTLFHAFFQDNGTQLVWRVFSGSIYREAVATVAGLENSWNHFAFHFSSVPFYYPNGEYSDVMRIWVNGTPVASHNSSGLTRITGGTTFRLARQGIHSAAFAGELDELRIWSRLFAQFYDDETGYMLNQLYNRTIPAGTSQLARYYRMNENTGTALADVTSGKTGSVTGASRPISGAPLLMDYQWFPANVLDLNDSHLSGTVMPGYTGTIGLRITNEFTGCSAYAGAEIRDLTQGVSLVAGADQLRTANTECLLADGWTHYYAYTSPYQKELLLSVKKNGNDIGFLFDSLLTIAVGTTPAWGSGFATPIAAPYVTNPNGWYAMNRWWNVGAPFDPASDVEVRTYFTDQDVAEVNALADPDLALAELRFFRLNGVSDPNPANGHAGINAAAAYDQPGYWEYAAADPDPRATWTYGAAPGGHYAQFTTRKLAGGGGGGGGGGKSGAFPVSVLPDAAPWLTISGPNPASTGDELRIHSTQSHTAVCRWADLTGRTIGSPQSVLLSATPGVVAVPALPAGTYLLHIHTLDKQAVVRIVIQE